MKKYMELTKLYFKNQLVWRSEVFFALLFPVSQILFAYLLWGAVFRSNEMIAGFTFQSMLLYYVINSFLSQIELSDRISKEITVQIRNGKFSKYMVLPVRIEAYFWSMELGMMGLYLLVNLVLGGLWIVIFNIPLTIVTEPVTLILAFIMIVEGLLFMAQLNFFLGILTLKFQEISTFLMIKDNLIQLLTGSIIPLVLLPEPLVAVMKVLPFYYTSYLPAMLLIGKCQVEALSGVLVMAVWCAAFAILNRVTYGTLRRKFDAVGI